MGSSWLGVAALTVAAAAGAGVLAVISPPFALVVVGLVVAVTYMGETSRRPLGEALIVAMIGISGGVDILQRVNAGAGSGQAVETVAFVVLAALVALTGIRVPEGAAGRALGLVALFVIWTLVSFTWGTVSTQSLQNVFVYIVFVLFMAIAATVVHYRGRGRPRDRLQGVLGRGDGRPRAVRRQRRHRRPRDGQDPARRGRSGCCASCSWPGSWPAA